MAMTKFNVLLDPKQVDALRAIQEATGAPLSVQIRRAIAVWIAAQGHETRKAEDSPGVEGRTRAARTSRRAR